MARAVISEGGEEDEEEVEEVEAEECTSNKYPVSLFCIIATEFCERFSFCGLRTILSLYLRNELLVEEDTATMLYHVFIMLCYLVPLIGALLADGILGRYKAILNFSMVYLMGNVLTCLAAIPTLKLPALTCTVIGLILIATGTGGIKPCVAAFGGDQFNLPLQQNRLQTFFSTFYFTINLGGLAGMVLTPILRKAVTCYGQDTCYAMGFGFPAALMLLSLILFVSGKPWYKIKRPEHNVIMKFCYCTARAIRNRIRGRLRKQDHWLDYAEECDQKLLNDMKVMYSLIILYMPLPLFWSLFDQQGSRWTFQASRTNGTVSIWGLTTAVWHISADQLQVLNPALVLLLIPVSWGGGSPLRRMTWGGVSAGLAFLASGLLELALQKSYPPLPPPRHAALNWINTLPCPLTVNPHTFETPLDPGKLTNFTDATCQYANSWQNNNNTEHGSRWTFQASRTNGTVSIWGLTTAVWHISADQLQVLNPALVLLLIPVSWGGGSPLRRMTWGGVSAGLAFLASGLLELALQKSYPPLPPPRHAALNWINTLPCPLTVNPHPFESPLDPGPLTNFTDGSRWTFQASRTNGTVSLWGLTTAVWHISADQLQVLNPALVLLLIPVSWGGGSPLRRMTWGGVSAGLAFLASGLLELALQKSYPPLPPPRHAALNWINTLPCPLTVNPHPFESPLDPGQLATFTDVLDTNYTEYRCTVHAPRICGGRVLKRTRHELRITLKEKQVETIITGLTDNLGIYAYVTDPVDYTKCLSGKPRLRIAYVHGANDIRNVTVTLKSPAADVTDIFFVSDFPMDLISLSPYMDLTPGMYTYEVASTFDFIRAEGEILLELGGVYTLVLREFRGAIDFAQLYTMTKPNTVHMAWLIPQYILISIGEILFAISGLEFSFIEAPETMKTITIAAWYLSVALGNLLVIIITEINIFRSQADEFFMYAGLIFVDMFIFARMGASYNYVNTNRCSRPNSECTTSSETKPLLSR